MCSESRTRARVIVIKVRNRTETIGGTTRAKCEAGRHGGAMVDTCVMGMIRATVGQAIVKDEGSTRGARANCWTSEMLGPGAMATKADDVRRDGRAVATIGGVGGEEFEVSTVARVELSRCV